MPSTDDPTETCPVPRVPRRALSRPFLLLGFLGLTVGFVTLYWWAVRTSPGQRQDILLFADAQSMNQVFAPLAGLLRPGLPVAVGLVALVLGALSARRRRWRLLAAATVVVLVSAVLSEVLKEDVLERPYLGDLGYTVNSFPSGHVTVATALVVATLLLWPPPLPRSAPWVAGGVVLVACVASVVGHAHRPSDALASVLLVGSVTCLTCALLRVPRTAPA
ncbi:phosphatase PAP2 family protein [Oerskovia merdavium]|uniref:Phosphatase PAP2 family protein n=1 Tax=Oerskovia merdavium TaxID=2762227 RepID=A0ABR8TUG3_9CELL|nr:phosphatase PAP2 family protein [Oerskovia merdavium]MBD7979406.1 phosphatase PAP2 family protein [Oerskovia merdavium]